MKCHANKRFQLSILRDRKKKSTKELQKVEYKIIWPWLCINYAVTIYIYTKLTKKWIHSIDKINIGLRSIVLLNNIHVRNAMKRYQYLRKTVVVFWTQTFLESKLQVHNGGSGLNLDFIPRTDWSLNSVTRILLLSIE